MSVNRVALFSFLHRENCNWYGGYKADHRCTLQTDLEPDLTQYFATEHAVTDLTLNMSRLHG